MHKSWTGRKCPTKVSFPFLIIPISLNTSPLLCDSIYLDPDFFLFLRIFFIFCCFCLFIMIGHRWEAKWVRKRGKGSGKVREPGLRLGSPEAQYMLARGYWRRYILSSFLLLKIVHIYFFHAHSWSVHDLLVYIIPNIHMRNSSHHRSKIGSC